MSDRAKELIAAVLALPAGERQTVADAVNDSLDDEEMTEDEWHEGWAAEINRRVADMESGKDPGVAAEEMFPELREDRG